MKLIKSFFALTFMILFLMLKANYQKDETTTLSGSLDKLNWSGKNYAVLNQLIKDYGLYGKYYRPDKEPYTVLHWDQTCAFLDVEDVTMHYQLFHFRFKMSKEKFAGILKDEINGVTQLPADYLGIHLADIDQDLKNDYNYLYDNYPGLNGKITLYEIQLTPQYKDFMAKISFLHQGYCAAPDPLFSAGDSDGDFEMSTGFPDMK